MNSAGNDLPSVLHYTIAAVWAMEMVDCRPHETHQLGYKAIEMKASLTAVFA